MIGGGEIYVSKFHVAGMKYFRVFKRCTKADGIRNADFKKELNIFSINEKIALYRNN